MLKPEVEVEKKNGLKNKYIMIIVIVVIAIAIAAVILNNTVMSTKLTSSVGDKKVVTVKRGNLSVGVQGSGPIYFTNSNKIISRTNGTITKVNFKTGDKVKAGDIICELDDKDAVTAVDITKQGLEQSKVASDAASEAAGNLSISAPFTGQISNIVVSVGDTVEAGATVLTITDTSKLKVLLSFNALDAAKITVGQEANVNITSTMQPVKGTVAYISNQPSATISGGQLYAVEVQINNPGAVRAGMTASADIKTSKGTVTSTDTAGLNYLNKQAVISKTGGTVKSIAVKEQEKANSGSILVEMENNTVTRAEEAANINIATSEKQINAAASKLDYFKIVSPIDGVLSAVNVQVGDIIAAGVPVSEVLDPSQMKLDIPVDEIDITKIAVGQKVDIRLDSIPSTLTTPVPGEVESIAVKGTSVSGVITYPVTIKLDGGVNILKGGMDVRAEIQVINKPNVLYVPVEAITKVNGKNYVSLEGSQDAKASTEVILGDSNVNYVEIVSGVKEGDKVILPEPYAGAAK